MHPFAMPSATFKISWQNIALIQKSKKMLSQDSLRKIELHQQELQLKQIEIAEKVEVEKERYFALRIRESLQGRMAEQFDPELSRRLDAAQILVGSTQKDVGE